MKINYLVSVLLIVLVMACEEDKKSTPAYVGTWVSYETDTLSVVPLVLLENKMQMKLQTSTWEMLSQIRMTGYFPDWEDWMGMRGTHTVDGEDVVLIFTDIGVREMNMQTMTFLDDEIVWYNAVTDPEEFEDYFDEYGPDDTTQEGKLIVSGNTLTIKTDDNGNGEYDEDEIMTFTRE